MEKVLLTGVTGFIGLHCCKQLLDQGYAVRGTLRDKIRKEEVITAMKESNTSELLNTHTCKLQCWCSMIKNTVN